MEEEGKENLQENSTAEEVNNISEESNQETNLKNEGSNTEEIRNLEKDAEAEENDSSSEESNLSDDEDKKKAKKRKLEAKQTEFDPKNIHYEEDVAIYTDPKTRYQYKWCKETNQWLPKSEVTYSYEDDTHTYTDADGVKYFWDTEKNAWFPKVDDDFMARYQMNYGFVDNTTQNTNDSKIEEKKTVDKPEVQNQKEKNVKKKVDPTPPSWFEMNDQHNTKVYVSNLPTDITEEEFVDLMQKCGLVMRDSETGKMKVKLYTIPDTDILKGDGLCSYIKIESVELALNLLDGYTYKGKKLKVERARFEMKGEYNPKLKPKKRRKKDKDKLKRMQEKLFDWRPEKMRGERSKHERVVIIKNLFDPSIFDKEVSLILEYQEDLREECKKCGEVKRVVLYDRHPEGVAQVTMKDPEEADEVVNLLNGRWFGQRKITAEIYNGKTKFKIAETDAEINQRLEKWEKYLESDSEAKTSNSKSNEAENKTD